MGQLPATHSLPPTPHILHLGTVRPHPHPSPLPHPCLLEQLGERQQVQISIFAWSHRYGNSGPVT